AHIAFFLNEGGFEYRFVLVFLSELLDQASRHVRYFSSHHGSIAFEGCEKRTVVATVNTLQSFSQKSVFYNTHFDSVFEAFAAKCTGGLSVQGSRVCQIEY